MNSTSAFTAFGRMWFRQHHTIAAPSSAFNVAVDTPVYGFPMMFPVSDFNPPVSFTAQLTAAVFKASVHGPPVGVGVIVTGQQDDDPLVDDLSEPTFIGGIVDESPVPAVLLATQPTFTRDVDAGLAFTVGFRFTDPFDAGLSPAVAMTLQFTILTGGPTPQTLTLLPF